MNAASRDPWQWRDLVRREIDLPRTVLELPVDDAVGRVVGAEVASPEDLPSTPIAAMDGFAVRRADLAAGSVTLPVSSEIPARPGAIGELARGTAARIMTGAPVPGGADVVVEVEATDADPFGPSPRTVTLSLQEVPAARRHIRGVGEEVSFGEVLARPGDRVGVGLVGLLRALGVETLPVERALAVGIVVTGDELVGTAGRAEVGAVRESNGEMLGAALRADGIEARAVHSTDTHADLTAALEEAAAHSDLVLTTGGIGHGAYDVVKTLLGERGSGGSRFEHLRLRPGGPQGFGHLADGTAVIHLPGTPVGALVGHHLFVRPLLVGERAAPRRVLRGAADPLPRPRRAGVLHALPGRLRHDSHGRECVDLLPGRRLAPYGRADAIVLLGGADGAESPEAAGTVPEETVLILPL